MFLLTPVATLPGFLYVTLLCGHLITRSLEHVSTISFKIIKCFKTIYGTVTSSHNARLGSVYIVHVSVTITIDEYFELRLIM